MLIDLVYLSVKTTVKLGYYALKGTYNTVNNIKKESKTNDNVNLLTEIQKLNKEIVLLKKDIQHLNKDSYVVVYPDSEIK